VVEMEMEPSEGMKPGIPSALTKFKHLTPSGRCQQIPLDP